MLLVAAHLFLFSAAQQKELCIKQSILHQQCCGLDNLAN